MRFLCTPSETPAAYPPAHVRYTAHLLRTNWLPSGYAKGCQSDSWTSVIVSLTGSGQPGSHRKANVVSHHMIDHSGLITRRIGAKVRHRPFSRQGQLTVLYESQVVFARRIVTGSKLHRHHLPGLGNVTHHRRVAAEFLVSSLSLALLRFDHRRIDVQHNLLSLMQRRRHQSLVDFHQVLQVWLSTPGASQPIVQRLGTRQRFAVQQPRQLPLPLQMAYVIQTPSSFVQHQQKRVEDR